MEEDQNKEGCGKSLIILIIAAIAIFLAIQILTSCTKQKTDLPQQTKAVTEYVSHCDQNWKVLETHISIHWCSVSGDDLKRFQTMIGKRDSSTCPYNAISWIEITKSDCNK